MDVSYWASSAQPWTHILEGCRAAEARGWHGIWIPDHFMPVADNNNGPGPTEAEMEPTLEGWTSIAAIGALIPRIRVGLMVGGNTYRHPTVVAKMATTIDHITDGRAVLGLGAGWQVNEHETYGFELGDIRSRSDRLEEACAAIRALLEPGRADFVGQHYQLHGAPFEPKPVQARMPLLVGGRGERRTLRTVARHADEWNAWGAPDDMAASRAVLARHCDAAGRDLDSIRVSAAALLIICDTSAESEKKRAGAAHRGGMIGTIDELRRAVAAYQEVGVDELVIPDFALPVDRRAETFDRLQHEVLDAAS